MIKFIIIIIIGVLGRCIGWSMGKVYEDVMVKNIPFKLKNNLSVETENGNINIYSWDKEEAKIEAIKKVRGYSKEKASELLNEIQIHISENSEGVLIETEVPKIKKGEICVDYNIFLPYESNLTLQSMNGGISVESIKGEIKVETMNGALWLKKVVGNIKGETMNGSIECEIDTLLESSNISLQTMNGNIELQIPEGLTPSIYAETHNGDINSDFPIYTRKSAIKGEKVIMLETLNGDISITQKP